jgi:predicted adenylyl cyclase CyaB
LSADWVVKNDYDPKKEAEKFGLYRVQFKFKRKLDPKKIKEAGGREIELLKQADAYYYPFRGNFGETGETLRIRKEKENFLFIYEGPPIDSDFKKRAAFKFKLSRRSAERFVDVYGFRAATVTKERRVFELDGIKFSTDRVFGRKGELAEQELGYFVEIFLDEEKEMEKEKLDNLLKKLGLSTEDFTTDSYLEILVAKSRR